MTSIQHIDEEMINITGLLEQHEKAINETRARLNELQQSYIAHQGAKEILVKLKSRVLDAAKLDSEETAAKDSKLCQCTQDHQCNTCAA